MRPKKITIISQALFPANTPRANRTTELAKELARQGHQVTVFAVLGEYDYTDFQKKYDLSVKPLGNMKFATLNSDGLAGSKTFIERAFIKLGGKKLFEYPNIELAFKTFKVLKKNDDTKVDLLITIAVPFPIHWGAAYAKSKLQNFPKTWVADCGDPYMGNPAHKKAFYFKYIEKWFCRKVDCISIPAKTAIPAYYPEFHHKIKIIPQGIDLGKYSCLPSYEPQDIPKFIYAGNFYKHIRDPGPFLEYLTRLHQDFRFIIYTKSDLLIKLFQKKLKQKLVIKDFIEKENVIREFAKADFLINFENKETVQTPSKLIDYAIAKRPVLSIKNKSDFPKIKAFLNHDFSQRTPLSDIKNYDITKIAKNFINLID